MGGRAGQRVSRMCSPGEQEESRCQRCISELKDIRLQLEACETRTVHRLRLPLDKEPARECAQRIAEQQAGPAPPRPPAPRAAVCWAGGISLLLPCLLRKRRRRWRG